MYAETEQDRVELKALGVLDYSDQRAVEKHLLEGKEMEEFAVPRRLEKRRRSLLDRIKGRH